MVTVRSVFFFIFFILSMLIFLIIYAPFIFFMAPTTPNLIVKKWGEAVVKGLKYFVGLTYKLVGEEYLIKGPCIIACKHQSGYETVALVGFAPLFVYILKKELMKIPLLGQGLYLSNQIPIDRKSKHKKKLVLEEAKKKIALGLSIGIFPEGTRTSPNDRDTVYKTGAAFLAQALQLDIIPISNNCGEFYSLGFKKYPGVATFLIHPPIKWNAAENPEDLTQIIKETIENGQRKIEGVGPLYKKT